MVLDAAALGVRCLADLEPWVTGVMIWRYLSSGLSSRDGSWGDMKGYAVERCAMELLTIAVCEMQTLHDSNVFPAVDDAVCWRVYLENELSKTRSGIFF